MGSMAMGIEKTLPKFSLSVSLTNVPFTSGKLVYLDYGLESGTIDMLAR